MKTTKPPTGLDGRGLAFWNEVAEAYALTRPDEWQLLEDACRTMSLVDELREAVERDGFTSTGSAGQRVINPLLTELRACRSELRKMLKQLGLPELAGEEDES
jgi:P27 family predicted phage terminase small subunit